MHISIVGRSAADERKRCLPSRPAASHPLALRLHHAHARLLHSRQAIASLGARRIVPSPCARSVAATGSYVLSMPPPTCTLPSRRVCTMASRCCGGIAHELVVRRRKRRSRRRRDEGDDSVTKRLPQSLREALSCVAEYKVGLSGVLGSELVERYLQLKVYEEGRWMWAQGGGCICRSLDDLGLVSL